MEDHYQNNYLIEFPESISPSISKVGFLSGFLPSKIGIKLEIILPITGTQNLLYADLNIKLIINYYDNSSIRQ